MAIDLAYPLVYGYALLLGLHWAAARSGRTTWLPRLRWLALGAPAADYVENVCLIWQLWTVLDDAEALIESPDLAAALDADPIARAHWDAFPPSARKFALIVAALVAIARLSRRRGARGRGAGDRARPRHGRSLTLPPLRRMPVPTGQGWRS